MVHDPRVTQSLSRLGGLYRDPARVDRDAASLLKSSVGSNLKPITAEMFEENGSACTVLVLQGTIAFDFRGNTYQLLMDMYLPAGYPNRPPVCYVRLAENMYLKENHKHVGKDGKVYLPYLHEWSPYSHNLIELVIVMSSVFSADPPVFSRAAPPPAASAATTAATSLIGGALNTWRVQREQKEAEARLARESAEANAAAEAARRAEREERERQQAAAKHSAWETNRKKQLESQVEVKIIRYLQELSRQTQLQVQKDAKDSSQLHIAKDKIQKQLKLYKDKKHDLEEALKQAEQGVEEIELFLEENRNAMDESGGNDKTLSIDEMVQPQSMIHQQMLDLSSENAAISDALYFLDRALYRGQLDCTTHLKQVRKLAKRQFLVRAHMMKINQVLATQ